MEKRNCVFIEEIYKRLAEAGLFDINKTPFVLKPYTSRTVTNPEDFSLLTVDGLLPCARIKGEKQVSEAYQDVFFNEDRELNYLHSDGLTLKVTFEENLKHRIDFNRDIVRADGVNRGLPFALVSACLDFSQKNAGKNSRIDTIMTFGQDFNFLKAVGLEQFPITGDVIDVATELEKQKINYGVSFNNEAAINNFVDFVKNVRASYK
jgi:hypothetical protein